MSADAQRIGESSTPGAVEADVGAGGSSPARRPRSLALRRRTRGILERRPAFRDLVRVIACATLGWVAIGTLIVPSWPGTPVSPNETSGWTPAIVVPVVAVLFLLLPRLVIAARRLARRLDASAPLRRRLLLGWVLVLLLGQAVLLLATAKTPGFDAGTITTSSWNRAHPGNGLGIGVPDASGYYSIVPNNLLLGWTQWLLFEGLAVVGLGGYETGLAVLLALNALALTGAAVCLLLTVRHVLGGPAVLLAVPLATLFLGVSPWINTPYSDTIGLALLSAGWFVATTAAARPRTGWWVLLGALAAVGALVKPTVALLLAPAVVLLILRARRMGWTKVRVAMVSGSAAIAGVAVYLGLLAAVDASGFVQFDVFNDPNALPFTHFMLMGVRGTGGFDYRTLIESTSITSPSARAAFTARAWVDAVAAKGPTGYPDFLARKLFWMLGDGSFFQGREGDAFTAYLLNGTPWSSVRAVWALGGRFHVLLASVWQAAWLVSLAAASAPLVLGDRRRALDWLTAMRVAVILLLLFLLVSEGRSRYVYLALPLILALAVGGMERLADAVEARRRATLRLLSRRR